MSAFGGKADIDHGAQKRLAIRLVRFRYAVGQRRAAEQRRPRQSVQAKEESRGRI